jgi:N-acetylated-alpha-linked acidic dipeptidase
MTPIALLLGLLLPSAQAAEPMVGFGPEAATKQRALEARFDAALDPADQRAWLKDLAAAPNHVGSPHDKANAETMQRLFASWGWDARIETFEVLYPTPLEVAVEMVAPTRMTARLREDNLLAGPEAAALKDALPAYNVYGADGDVTADIVYVNYGQPEDYKELARRGIDVRGKIVLARYGGGWRGLKPKLAAEHGAIGCLIFSDPRDDGYWLGDAYPASGNRPPDALQRGSVGDITQYSGDPLTPGVGAVKGAKRLALKDAKTLMRIPVLPLAYRDAEPLLRALAGPVAPPSWRGALAMTYHIGPGPAKVHMTVRSDWRPKTLYNVIATLRGSEAPDEWVIRGNHHDGWVVGAWDPLGGNVAMMAEAKAIGTLARAGERPRRTLVYASWDGEEPGLLGSTEWAEAHADELKKKAIAYVNSDTNERGLLGIGGSQALERLVNEVTGDVKDPETGVSVAARKLAKERVDALAKRKAGTPPSPGPKTIVLEPLGSGSDYTPFSQHLGIAALNLGYGGEAEMFGLYHSSYDTYDSFVRFGDPDFKYGIALAQTAGRLMLRLANAERIPLTFTEAAEGIGKYLDEVHKLADKQRGEAEDLGKLLDDKAYELASDPQRPVGPPEREAAVPYFNLAPLDNAAAHLKRAAAAFDKAVAAATLDAKQRAAVNGLLKDAELLLTDARGLPGRSWYTHMISAPGLFAGYGAKTLPAVRESIEERHFDDADRYAVIVAERIEAYAARIDKAAAAAK